VSLKEQGADILQRVSMLIMRATLFAKIGKPERAFSAALRAASVSFKARLMPTLWNAVGLLANILNSMGEYGAAERLLHAVIPQVRVDGDWTRG
jgi:anaphase-promoting complex subunit 5